MGPKQASRGWHLSPACDDPSTNAMIKPRNHGFGSLLGSNSDAYWDHDQQLWPVGFVSSAPIAHVAGRRDNQFRLRSLYIPRTHLGKWPFPLSKVATELPNSRSQAWHDTSRDKAMGTWQRGTWIRYLHIHCWPLLSWFDVMQGKGWIAPLDRQAGSDIGSLRLLRVPL